MLCNNKCSEKLDNYDILYILKYTKNKNIKEYLLEKLNLDTIEYFLPLLISYIHNDNLNDFSITNYIIKQCTSIKLIIELFLQILIIVSKNDSCDEFINIHSIN